MFTERHNPKTIVNILSGFTPYVSIDEEAAHKMWQYVQQCKGEVGWLGTTEVEGRNIIITDVMLFDQEVHSTTTEITPEGLSKFATELMKKPDGMEIWNSIKVWGHSHVNMHVSPSGQDNAQMRVFSQGGHPWFLRIIANKKGDLKVDLFDYANGLEFIDLPWEIRPSASALVIEERIKELLQELDKQKKALEEAHKAPIAEEIKLKVRPFKSKLERSVQKWNDPRYRWDTVLRTWVLKDEHLKKIEEKVEKAEKRENKVRNLKTNADVNFGEARLIKNEADIQANFSDEELETIGMCPTIKSAQEYIVQLCGDYLFTLKDMTDIYEYAYDNFISKYVKK